jgi:hypothetical protein
LPQWKGSSAAEFFVHYNEKMILFSVKHIEKIVLFVNIYIEINIYIKINAYIYDNVLAK